MAVFFVFLAVPAFWFGLGSLMVAWTYREVAGFWAPFLAGLAATALGVSLLLRAFHRFKSQRRD